MSAKGRQGESARLLPGDADSATRTRQRARQRSPILIFSSSSSFPLAFRYPILRSLAFLVSPFFFLRSPFSSPFFPAHGIPPNPREREGKAIAFLGIWGEEGNKRGGACSGERAGRIQPIGARVGRRRGYRWISNSPRESKKREKARANGCVEGAYRSDPKKTSVASVMPCVETSSAFRGGNARSYPN